MNDRIPGTTWDNPIWYGKFRIYISGMGYEEFSYVYCHDDYDGALDADDNRAGYGRSIEACKAEIDERWPNSDKL